MLYEVVLTQTFLNQQCINRWNYVGSGTPAAVTPSFALTNALGAVASVGVYDPAKMMKLIAGVQSNGVTFDNIIVKAIYDVLDFYALPFVEPLGGSQTGDSLPPFAAVGFRTSRVRQDIRRATKRFVGVTETNQAGGVLTSAFQTNSCLPLATAMAATLTYLDEGNTLTFSPVVVGKQRYDPETGLASPTGSAYRYYPTLAEQEAHLAQGVIWDVYTTVRSQASRQIGHGR